MHARNNIEIYIFCTSTQQGAKPSRIYQSFTIKKDKHQVLTMTASYLGARFQVGSPQIDSSSQTDQVRSVLSYPGCPRRTKHYCLPDVHTNAAVKLSLKIEGISSIGGSGSFLSTIATYLELSTQQHYRGYIHERACAFAGRGVNLLQVSQLDRKLHTKKQFLSLCTCRLSPLD